MPGGKWDAVGRAVLLLQSSTKHLTQFIDPPPCLGRDQQDPGPFGLLLFLFVLMRIIEIARSVYSSSFSSLMVFGFLSIWFFHLFVNVGMALGIMPVTGLPLPFVSYGGSFLVACYFTLGILLRISTERFNYWVR